MNTTQLISSIKLKGGFPDDSYFANDEYLTILNDQLKLDIIPLLMKLNEEYFLTDKDYVISSTATYRIPKRAIGAKLRDVKLVDAAGGITNLRRLFEEDKATGRTGYYLKRNVVELSPDISSGTLRLSYFAAPSTLVLTTSCGQIQSINTTLNQVVVSSVPSTFVTGASMDFIQNSNPYDLLSMDVAITGISGTTITFSSLPTDLAVNDWLCIAGQAPVALIPEELQPVLVQSALCSCLSAKKDKAAEFELSKLEQMKSSATNLLDPRVESPDSKVRPQGFVTYFRNR